MAEPDGNSTVPTPTNFHVDLTVINGLEFRRYIHALMLAPATPPLELVLRFALFDCLPLHVRRRIGTAACEQHNVIPHVARTRAALFAR
jgi:hypothetical protein